MALKGIDISNWQKGINVAAVPGDFVIVKATQGTGFLSPDFKRQIDQAIGAGKLVGIYHYINGVGAAAEMEHFIRHWSPYKGRAIPMLDWESEQNRAWRNESYLESCIREFIGRTNIPPIVYASLSVFPWDVCSRNNCGTWVAQYANMNPTGYQDTPWNEGAYHCTIRQYSSTGRLPNYNGNLDLDKAYVRREGWMAYANPGNANQGNATAPGAGKTVQQLADEVMNGLWGNGQERRARLGSLYDEVQAEVNRRLQANKIDDLARRTLRGEFGNGNQRRQRLGPLYDQVQKRVNELSR